MRVIHADVIMNFGKHKNRPVTDVLAEDTGYFYWLLVNGKATLAKDVSEVVTAWAGSHPRESGRIRQTAHSNGTFHDPNNQSAVSVADVAAAATRSAPIDRGADWGSW